MKMMVSKSLFVVLSTILLALFPGSRDIASSPLHGDAVLMHPADSDIANSDITVAPQAIRYHRDGERPQQAMLQGSIIAPDTVYMGLIPTGTCDSLTIPYLNSGQKAIAIDSIYLAGGDVDDFSIMLPLSGTIDHIEPGASADIGLRFCPKEDGCSRTGLVLITRTIDGSAPRREHRIGLGGCAGRPRLSVSRDTLGFGNVPQRTCRRDSVIIRNSGTYPLIIERIPPRTTGPYRIYPSSWETGITLLPDSSRSMLIFFCPNSAGVFTDSIIIRSNAPDPVTPIHLFGRGERWVVMNDTVDLPPVHLRNCIDTLLELRFSIDTNVRVTGIRLMNPAGDQGFIIPKSIPPDPPFIASGGMKFHLHIRFCPRRTGPASDVIEILSENHPPAYITLRGEASVPRIWLDTTTANAGDILYLHARLDTVAPDAPPIGRYSLRLGISPVALFPIRALSPGGAAPPSLTYTIDGNILIEGNNDELPLPGGMLVRIEFRGLSTGNPSNVVTLREASLRDSGRLESNGDGLVRLNGCDIDYGVRLRTGVAMKSVWSDPAGAEIIITYVAPKEQTPMLRIFDLSGKILSSLPLDEGTGGEQRVQLPVAPLYRGTYLLELSTKNDRAVAPVFIAD